MRVSRSSLRRRTSSFEIRALLLFFTLYILAALYLRKYYSWRDPGSFFFDIDRAYEPRYSAHRTYQANNYITSGPPKYEKAIEDPNPHICVGIATVARENGVGYFHTTVGSALQGLTPDERRRIYLALLIANTDPTKHEAYSTSWFYDVADAALTYEELPQDKLDHLRQLEQGDAFISKAIKDYTYLLKHCIAKGAAYIAMVEDDTAFQDGWLHRTEQAIREIESSSDPDCKFKQELRRYARFNITGRSLPSSFLDRKIFWMEQRGMAKVLLLVCGHNVICWRYSFLHTAIRTFNE